MSEPVLLSILLGIALASSFLLSGMEAGVFALSPMRIRLWMRGGSSVARRLHAYLQDPENFLWTILVGNIVANFVAICLLLKLLGDMFPGRPVLFCLVWLIAVFLFYSLCDLLPKMLFRQFPNRLCLVLVPPFRLLHRGLSPLVAVVTWFSGGLLRWTGGRTFTGEMFGDRAELRLLMQESAQALNSDERSLINRVLDLHNITIDRVMVPISQVAGVEVRSKLGEALAMARERGVTRLPAWQSEPGQRHVSGMVNLRALLYQEHPDMSRSVSDYLQPALFLSARLTVEDALRRMQRSGQRLAIVLDADQREVGVVSLQDILKAIFGEVSL